MSDPATWIWVLIPLAGISIAPIRMWFKLKEKQIDAQTNLAAEKSAQYAQHMERFEGRLRVLEQIVTDGGRPDSCADRGAARTATKADQRQECGDRRRRLNYMWLITNDTSKIHRRTEGQQPQ